MNLPLNSIHGLGNPLPQRVAIVRSLPGLGDWLCFVPALRALRAALPNAQVTLIGLPGTVQLIQRFHHYVDDWLEFPGYPGIPEVPLNPHRVVSFLQQTQQLNLDLALQMHGNGSHINGFVLLLGAKSVAGFYPKHQCCPDSDRFFPYPDDAPEVLRHLLLLNFLGISSRGAQLEFPLWKCDWQAFEAIAHHYHLQSGHYICIHPGASVSDRCWSVDRFITVANDLADQGYRIVLTGTANEVGLTQTIAQQVSHPVVDLAGKTDLGLLAAILKRAALLVCNDTGVSHLADALQTRSVVIFSNSEVHRWAPLDRDQHQVLASEAGKNVSSGHPVTVDRVLAAARDLLKPEVKQEVMYAS
jgi:ADP-heptose:LPS heptosyltransferase